jgi:hypothetical protein
MQIPEKYKENFDVSNEGPSLETSKILLQEPRAFNQGKLDDDIIHLMCAPEENSLFCFPESLNVSRDAIEGNLFFLESQCFPRLEGNIEILGKTKLFPDYMII